MPNRIVAGNGHLLLVVSDEAPALSRAQDIVDLVAEALSQRAGGIVVPVMKLDPAFFQLRTGLAGTFAQKIANYRLKLAIVGDISAFTATSKAFADFVRESNRGASLFFLPDMDTLAAKLSVLPANR